MPVMDRGVLSQTFESYFDLFIAAARNPDGTGQPTREALLEVSHRLPECDRRDVRRCVYTLLDALLGWDLIMAEPEPFGLYSLYQDAFLGHIADPEATPELLEAAKTALVSAIREENPEAVAPPLFSFWERFPYYRPEHMGRCYPHGGHRHYESAVDCHIAHLRRMADIILQPQESGKA